MTLVPNGVIQAFRRRRGGTHQTQEVGPPHAPRFWDALRSLPPFVVRTVGIGYALQLLKGGRVGKGKGEGKGRGKGKCWASDRGPTCTMRGST